MPSPSRSSHIPSPVYRATMHKPNHTNWTQNFWLRNNIMLLFIIFWGFNIFLTTCSPACAIYLLRYQIHFTQLRHPLFSIASDTILETQTGWKHFSNWITKGIPQISFLSIAASTQYRKRRRRCCSFYFFVLLSAFRDAKSCKHFPIDLYVFEVTVQVYVIFIYFGFVNINF